MGGVEPLANGNLLVTDSLSSRAFELTREGTIAWDYYEPALVDAASEPPAVPGALPAKAETVTIYRMSRVPLAPVRTWLPRP